jgi:hypothetical protein
MLMVLACAATAPRDRLPAIRVEPLVNVIVPLLLVLPEFPTVTAPETVSLGLPLAANVRVAMLLLVPNPKLAQAALLVSTVTV